MLKLIGRVYLWLFRWKFVGELPGEPKYVFIASPHTSNWDLPHMLAISWLIGLKVNWMGKHVLFKAPFGWILRRMGGVPVDRRSTHNAVQQMADEFRRRDRFALAVSTAGTRSYTDYWKSGFYWIAREANVPIRMGYLDFARREAGLGPRLVPTDDVRADMDRLRAFYGAIVGKVPEKVSRIRLRVEDDSSTEAHETDPYQGRNQEQVGDEGHYQRQR